MFAFTVVWLGQAISLLGSEMSGFAMALWVFQMAPEGYRATAFAFMGAAHVIPLLVMSPFAGAIVDRSNRKLMMIVSDLAAGLSTIAILILMATGALQLWHLYVATAVNGAFQTFQWPAYSAAISLMVDKKHYARTSAMMDLAGNTTGIFAPLLAGALIAALRPNGILIILLIDVVTFIFAIGGVLIAHIPQPQVTEEGRKGQGSLLSEAGYGFKYIFQRPSLLGLQLVFLTGNFFSNLGFTVMVPMILTRAADQKELVLGSLGALLPVIGVQASGDLKEIVLGVVNAAGALGGILGGVWISAWGGPKRRVYGVLGGWALSGLFGACIIGLGRSMPIWALGVFFSSLVIPLVNSSNQAIWQAKVAPDVQGRVFAIRRLIAWFVSPIATLIAGPLADFVMEPGMRPGAFLSESLSWVTGVGPGAGMSLMILFSGVMMIAVALVAYSFFPAIRNAETILPDHQALAKPEAEGDLRTRLQALLEARQKLIGDPNTPDQERELKRIAQELRAIGRQRALVKE
jgi:MFS family permease